MSKGSLWGLNFVLKKFFFVFFLVFAKMSREITVFSVRNNQHVCHNCLTRVQEYFLKNFFWRSSFFLHWALRDFLCHFGNNLSVPLSVLLSVCHLDQFVVKDFLSKTFFSYQFRILIEVDQSVFVIFSAKLTTLHSKSPMDQFEDIKPFRKSFVHLSVADLVRKSKSYFSENNRQVRQNCLPRVQGDLLKKFFFGKSSFFISSLSIERDFSVSSTNFCHSGCQYCLLSVSCSNLMWNFFYRIYFSAIIFRHWAKINRFLTKVFSAKVKKTAFYESKGSFWGHQTVLTNICLFHLSFGHLESKNKSFFFGKRSAGLSKTLPRVQGDFSKKNFLKSFFFSFHHWTMSDFFLSFRQKLVGPVVSTAFCLSIAPVCGEKTFQKFDWPLFNFFFGQFDDTAFYESERPFCRPKDVLTKFLYVYPSFSSLERKNKGFFCRKTNSRYAKSSYHLSRKSVERTFFRMDSFFCSSLRLERHFFLDFDKKFSAVSSKLLSVCPLQQVVVKKISVKIVFLPSFSVIQQKLVGFSETFSVNLTKLLSTSTKDQLEEITLFGQKFSLFF